MNIVYTVRSESPQAPLAQLLQLPLGLDIWQVEEDHVVLRAEEAQAARQQWLSALLVSSWPKAPRLRAGRLAWGSFPKPQPPSQDSALFVIDRSKFIMNSLASATLLCVGKRVVGGAPFSC